jgi:hypothetical protein
MAVTLSVTLTDAEQAKLLEIASVLYPSATPAQVKSWAEKNAKTGLRRIIALEMNNHANTSLDTAWPAESIVLAPAQP